MREWGQKLWGRAWRRPAAAPPELPVEGRHDRLRELASDMQGLQRVAIRRLHMVPVPRGNGIPITHKLTLLAEFDRLGFRVANPEALNESSPELFLDYAAIIATLVAMRGGEAAYTPLMPGFPEHLPEDMSDFSHRLAAYRLETRERSRLTALVPLRIVSAEQAVASLRAWSADAGRVGATTSEDLQRDRELLHKMLGPRPRIESEIVRENAVPRIVVRAICS